MPARPAIAVAIALLLICLAIPCAGANLLTDAAFEDIPPGTTCGTSQVHLSGWRYFSVSGAGGSLETVSPGMEGSIAIKLARTSASGDTGLDRDLDRIPAAPYHRYRGTVWAKSDTGSQLLLKFAAHDASGTWLLDYPTTFTLTSTYTAYTIEVTAPQNTGLLNFAIRVAGIGSLEVDLCSVTDLGATPSPNITYPCSDTVDSFKPVVAFAAVPHTAYQVLITNGSTTVWDSGQVTSTAYTTSCPVTLQPQTSYQVKAQVQSSLGWSGYGQSASFTTPAAPVVKITNPAEADSLRGPTATVNWTVDSPSSVTSQKISLDGGTAVALATATRSNAYNGLTEGMHTVTVTATTSQGTTSDTSRFYVRITPAPTGTIYYYDLSYIWSYNRSDPAQAKLIYDISLAIVALQGIVNRNGPRLYLKFWSTDDKWWPRLRESGNWLANKTQVTLPSGLANIATLFNTFSSDIKGAVVWDPNVYATSNVATTVAGADDVIPVRYDPTSGSVYDQLVQQGPRLSVLTDLTGKFTGTGTIWGTNVASTGSKKNDAYIWARTKYLETGRSNPSVLMYAVDGYWLAAWQSTGFPGYAILNRDYVVQKRGFVFDLSIWADETPIDDPTQTLGLDLSTLRSILATADARAPGMVHIVDAKPWPMKYTTYQASGGHHAPVSYEWECIRWFTAYNAVSEADSYAYVDMNNASIYGQFPLPDRLTQNRRLSLTDLRKLGYIDTSYTVSQLNFLNLYIGDYDSAMWLMAMGTGKWDDTNRGTVPMSWAFNPNLIDRGAAFLDYFYRTRTANDSFIAGDSGAGYVNPTRLLSPRDSGLASAYDIWVPYNLDYFRKTNIKMSGFLINGTAGKIGSDVDAMYSVFSVDGTFSQPTWYPQGDHMSGTMPALKQRRDLTNTAATDVGIVQPSGLVGKTSFLNYRTVLVGPTYVRDLFNGIVAWNASFPWALVDAPTYAALDKAYMGVVQDCRATYTFDTIPPSSRAGANVSVSIGIRNDGWVDWSPTGSKPVSLLVKWKNGTQVVASSSTPLPRAVPSGGGIVMDAMLTAPSAPGNYVLSYEVARQGVGFSALGDYCWEKLVTVDMPLEGGSTEVVKSFADGTVVTLRDAVVTAGTSDLQGAFYVENAKRVSGIRVSLAGTSGISVSRGDVVTLVGTLSTEAGERVLIGPTLISVTPAL